jgi:hypothetical protein
MAHGSGPSYPLLEKQPLGAKRKVSFAGLSCLDVTDMDDRRDSKATVVSGGSKSKNVDMGLSMNMSMNNFEAVQSENGGRRQRRKVVGLCVEEEAGVEVRRDGECGGIGADLVKPKKVGVAMKPMVTKAGKSKKGKKGEAVVVIYSSSPLTDTFVSGLDLVVPVEISLSPSVKVRARRGCSKVGRIGGRESKCQGGGGVAKADRKGKAKGSSKCKAMGVGARKTRVGESNSSSVTGTPDRLSLKLGVVGLGAVDGEGKAHICEQRVAASGGNECHADDEEDGGADTVSMQLASSVGRYTRSSTRKRMDTLKQTHFEGAANSVSEKVDPMVILEDYHVGTAREPSRPSSPMSLDGMMTSPPDSRISFNTAAIKSPSVSGSAHTAVFVEAPLYKRSQSLALGENGLVLYHPNLQQQQQQSTYPSLNVRSTTPSKQSCKLKNVIELCGARTIIPKRPKRRSQPSCPSFVSSMSSSLAKSKRLVRPPNASSTLRRESLNSSSGSVSTSGRRGATNGAVKSGFETGFSTGDSVQGFREDGHRMVGGGEMGVSGLVGEVVDKKKVEEYDDDKASSCPSTSPRVCTWHDIDVVSPDSRRVLNAYMDDKVDELVESGFGVNGNGSGHGVCSGVGVGDVELGGWGVRLGLGGAAMKNPFWV